LVGIFVVSAFAGKGKPWTHRRIVLFCGYVAFWPSVLIAAVLTA
jgi:hypothetical protein